ncbi:MAG TPA: beta-ketoacyl-[acyl-carrier-protein] synthase family protein [Actinotalea caeni]|uniref:beta-ketoacyl-[acyl-carrier-protein] synthase family protein n=1 Tax=Actinotalea caeni TaxID=1348467 RepID=UPI002B4B2252|nr:beta-ketoacyl-[acyl-carrier-protein] synthase family protein [Actinotalea caeni]HLV54681.1 beta-ketoacyl-[acyl-carrier-protein] synthase family protein [Actinotalea caeni]
MTNHVVITGLGVTSPLGGDVASTWEAALAGRSGVNTLEHDWVEQYDAPVRFAGELAVPAAEVLSVPETRRMDPSAQYAVVAAREAWADAGSPELDPTRLATVVASGIGGVWTLLSQWDNYKEKGPRRVSPLTVPMLMPNAPSAQVSMLVGARAGAHTPVSACASGAEAIGYAAQIILSGRADVVLAGGTEAPIHPLPLAAFARMQALSTRNDDPQGASRPYDVTRDGFVMGEGAGIVALERESHARARGAHIYARIAGFGITSDAADIAAPSPEGQERAMRAALAESELSASDIVHVNAHATSTPVGDMGEAGVIAKVLGDRAAVSATKSMTGHLLGGAGALETIFTVLALRDRKAPPTINVTQPEPDLPIDLVRDVPRDLPAGDVAAFNNGFGFGGHNASLIIASV